MTAPRSNAGHDQNRVPTLIGVSTVDGITPVPAEVDPTNGQLQVSGSGGGGGGAVTIADGADVAQGTTTDTAYSSGSGTIVSILKGIFNVLSSVMLTKITNGTNTADVVAGDTGFNGLAGASGVKTLTFTTSASGAQTILANTDVRGYTWMEVVYTSIGSGLALAGQFSTASGGTYVTPATFQNLSSNATIPAALATTANAIYSGPIVGNFFQIAVSALVSGTFAGTVTLYTTARSHDTTTISASQSGSWNVGFSPPAVATGTIIGSSTIITTPSIINDISGMVPITIHGSYTGISFGITVSDDNGTTFYNVPIYDSNNSRWLNPGATITPANSTNALYWVPLPISNVGAMVRVAASAFSTGSGAIRIEGSAATLLSGSTMAQLMSASGNGIGANVTSAGALQTDSSATTQPTTTTDGTNTVNILKNDGTAAGQNAEFVAGTRQEQASLTAGSLNADLVSSTDVSGYKSGSIQIGGIYSGTLTIQGSNDNSTFVTTQATNLNGSSSSLTGGTTTSTGIILTFPIYYRYLRIRMTSYVSGTATGTLELFSFSQGGLSNAAVQSGTWSTVGAAADGIAVSGNPVRVAGSDGTNTRSLLTDAGGRLKIVPGQTATCAITSVASANTSTSLLAANTARSGAYFFNDSTAILYLAFAGSASTTAYTVQIAAQGFFEMPIIPVYTGAIFGIWASANGSVRITELS